MRVFLLVIALLFGGCGYKPASKVAKSVLGERVFVEVAISIKDPQNSVLIKDALKEALISRLHTSLVPKNQADTSIYAKLKSVSFGATIYDEDGYVIAYKATVTLSLDTTFKDGKRETINATGEYDFPIEANSVISDTRRFEAIRYASLDALDEFVAAVAVKGMRHGQHNQ